MAPIAQQPQAESRHPSTHNPVNGKETNGNQNVGALGRTKDGRPLKIRAYPTFDSLEEERLYRKQHLAAAYRVFAERGETTRLRAPALIFLSPSQKDSYLPR